MHVNTYFTLQTLYEYTLARTAKMIERIAADRHQKLPSTDATHREEERETKQLRTKQSKCFAATWETYHHTKRWTRTFSF